MIEWVDQLPKANIGQTTRQLFQAISELNRVRLLPEERYKILEQLRAQIHFVSRSLSKHYLNQPIILPKQAKQVANLSQTLHQQMITGYTIVASHASALGKRIVGGKPDQLIAKALYRAITESTVNLIRNFQLYESSDKHLWQQLHQFYLLGQQHNALSIDVNDKEIGDGTVLSAYIRVLLLGASKPKQLRQEDFKQLLAPLTSWSQYCQIEHADQDSLFVINPLSDSPPLYREAYESAIDSSWLSLDTSRLIHHFEALRQQQENNLMFTDGQFIISNDLLGHLFLAWSEMSKRTFMRLESNDELNISMGLSSTHHFASGEMSFEALLSDSNSGSIVMEKSNRFMRPPTIEARQKDVWDSPYESNVGQTNIAMESIDFHISKSLQDDKETSKYRNHQVSALNSSPQGYCIKWPDDDPITIKAGEIVGIQEPHGHNWSIGVIRWIDHQHDQSTQLGLELISPTASPYGARIVQKTGSPNEYLRALVLPEMSSLNIPVTLITPRVPFKEGQKVTLNQQGKEVQIQLTKKLNETGAYNRFEFRKIGSVMDSDNSKKTTPSPDIDDGFDSLWKNL
ncbi:hypothetical protein NO559_09935 [Dasania sp. GY-MA-18]|uniref:Molecular chaperone n=1 Tax=Dasania phycosphaerae TaxID=2950436 RepID=A0A9J6RM37_9GAMM|nr:MULTISPECIES: hypothetical protein [Dasania]MCR8923092.1 hypothetical protein [Dasania sp. GY-MA-18]MCZ0865524.1 hypothetical protein [Dasania phycosphaerae]MCZ0869249.1 hypothetical protein [Dasania phycosphaerae]